ncbi:MAG: hypothetical protein BGO41_14980 [Clostridiales bacterium 38-18]|nr:MAG: hypothetical protein BGO41_14980 [Clostridiales bacterium 38-18]
MNSIIITFKNKNEWLRIPLVFINVLIVNIVFKIKFTQNMNQRQALVTISIILLLIEWYIIFIHYKKIKIYKDHIQTNSHKIKKEDLIKYEWPQNNKIESELHIFAYIKLLGVFKVKRKIRIYLSKELKEEVDLALSQLLGAAAIENLQE